MRLEEILASGRIADADHQTGSKIATGLATPCRGNGR